MTQVNNTQLIAVIYDFIKEHQTCAEVNPIIPNVDGPAMMFRCSACDDKIKFVATVDSETSN